MKILFLCHRFPFPPAGGATIRPFHIIRHLGRRHDVTVASLIRSEREGREGAGLADHCRAVIAERVHEARAWARMVALLATGEPSSFGYFRSARLARRVREAAATGPYDLVFAHCSSMAPYVADLAGVPKILDFCDMDSQKWLAYGAARRFPLSAGYFLEGLKLQLAEQRLAARFDVCTVNTEAELRTLDGLNAPTRTDWFPNGVDAERFRPADTAYDPDLLCFVGRMDYFPNEQCMIEFCAEVLPRVRARRPRTELAIVGAAPTVRVRRLGRIAGVTVTGSVPEVQPFVQRAALTVAPLTIARGTQNKILESMAMGVPVVCSHRAAGGVDAVPGEHLLAARDPDEYAAAILRVLDDPAERERLARAGRVRVVSHHSWAASMSKLDRIIEECVARFRSAA